MICSRLKIYKYRDLKKQGKIDAIKHAYQNRNALANLPPQLDPMVDTFDDEPGPTTRQKQCPYRLINLIFSDEFSEDFSHLGDQATKEQLDKK